MFSSEEQEMKWQIILYCNLPIGYNLSSCVSPHSAVKRACFVSMFVKSITWKLVQCTTFLLTVLYRCGIFKFTALVVSTMYYLLANSFVLVQIFFKFTALSWVNWSTLRFTRQTLELYIYFFIFIVVMLLFTEGALIKVQSFIVFFFVMMITFDYLQHFNMINCPAVIITVYAHSLPALFFFLTSWQFSYSNPWGCMLGYLN